jgi:hypothetical protein
MTQPVFPIYRVPEVPYPELVIKSRREVNTRDTVNARNFEHWQTNGKYLVQDRPDLNKQTPFQDFLPISSRMNERNYANQPRYDATGPKLGNNIYFDKYDVAYDNRNAVRELQAVVYEDKIGEGIRESSKLLRRNFDSRFMPSEDLDKITQARLVLRPSLDDIRKIYRDF